MELPDRCSLELIGPGTVPVLFKGGDTHEDLLTSDSEYRVPDLDRDSGLDDRYRRVLNLPVLNCDPQWSGPRGPLSHLDSTDVFDVDKTWYLVSLGSGSV